MTFSVTSIQTSHEATGSPGNLRYRSRVFTPLPDRKPIRPGYFIYPVLA